MGVLADHSSQRHRSQCSLSARTNPAAMCCGSYRCANASEVLGFSDATDQRAAEKGQIALYWPLGFLILAQLLKIEMFRGTQHTYLRQAVSVSNSKYHDPTFLDFLNTQTSCAHNLCVCEIDFTRLRKSGPETPVD